MGITFLKNNDIYLFRKAFFKCFSFFSKKIFALFKIQTHKINLDTLLYIS